MESEKVKEIKSVLESFAIDDKEMTLIQSPVPQNQSCMKTIKYADILTLINELESENERLRKENETLRNAKVVYENVDYCYEDLKKAEKRIAELEKEIEENAFYSKGYAQGIKNTYEVVIPEKLKQFAERLKYKAIRRQEFIGELVIDDIKYVDVKSIDETLKEFIK